jgi:monovalent cation/proton antiporter MnhG/PhaG subunit
MIKETVVAILLGLAVAIVLLSSLGVLAMGDVYQKLHFLTPASLVAPVLVAAAVFVQAGLTENTGETLVALFFVVIAGPYLSHATIRAARIRDQGDWRTGKRTPPPSREGTSPEGTSREGTQ